VVTESVGQPPEATRDRSVDRAVTAAQIALGFLVASFGPYLAALADELERPRGQLVWVTSTFGVGLLIAAVAGPAVLRAGPGRVLWAACLAMGAGSAAMAATPALPVAGTGSVLVGLGCAAVALVTPVLLAGPGAARRLTKAVAAASTAGVCAPLAFGGLEYLGLPGRWSLLLTLPVLLAALARPAVVAAERLAERRRRLPTGPAAVGWLRIVLSVSCEFCFVVWAVARLLDTGASLGTASVLSTGFVIGMAVGRLVGPRFADHPRAVLVASLTAMAGTAIVYAGDDAATVTAGITLASLGIALLYPISLAQLLAVPGLDTRHAASIGSLASGTAVVAAPAALGWMDTVISLRTAFLLPIPLLVILLTLIPRRPVESATTQRLPGPQALP
jgi:MFS family permease